MPRRPNADRPCPRLAGAHAPWGVRERPWGGFRLSHGHAPLGMCSTALGWSKGGLGHPNGHWGRRVPEMGHPPYNFRPLWLDWSLWQMQDGYILQLPRWWRY